MQKPLLTCALALALGAAAVPAFAQSAGDWTLGVGVHAVDPKSDNGRLAGGTPNHLVMRLTDPVLFKCPFVMMTEVGGLFIFPEEVEPLRDYLLKGGFLWADDFWGESAWWAFESQIRKVLPSGPYPIIDLPADHPMMRMMFNVREVTQIPSIQHWRGSGGGTAETFDARVPHARGIADDHGRLMVLITHNTDYGDSWEREAADPEYFQQFSVPGYAFGINAILYAMTH